MVTVRSVGWNTLGAAKHTNAGAGFSLSHRMGEGRGEGLGHLLLAIRAMHLTLVGFMDSFPPWNRIRRPSLSFVTGLPLNKPAETILLACDGPVDLFARDARRQRRGR